MERMFRSLQTAVCAAALSFASLSPVTVKAEEESPYGEIDGDPIVSVIELNAEEVTAEKTVFTDPVPLTKAEDLEMVTVIVELDEPCVLEAGLVPGSSQAEKYAKMLTADQNTLGNAAVKSIEAAVTEETAVSQTEVIDHFTNVINGMSMRVPRGMISRIRQLPGVKRVFEEVRYSRPETAESDSSYEPQVSHAADLIGAGSSYTGEYHGEGMVIGVFDTGLDLSHSAFVQDPKDPKITETDQFDFKYAEDTYKNSKVPFGYDYADGDEDVINSAGGELGLHGTHVAGICAGNDNVITGIAPEAQIAVFKIYGDRNPDAPNSVIVRALEDAVILKPDVINLSLGAAAGDDGSHESADYYDEKLAMGEIFQRVYESGILISASAGNDGYIGSAYGHARIHHQPHRGLVDSPSSYEASLSVASAANGIITNSYLCAGGSVDKIYFRDPAWMSEKQFSSLAAEAYPAYEFCGLGKESDFEGIDITGKIALVEYGEITVMEKQANAAASGAIGMIVYNNTKGSVPNLITDQESIPVISISQRDGNRMKGMENRTISLIDETEKDSTRTAGTSSFFSSWGTDDALRIKPEISGIGDNVFSAVPGGYASLSGTSMSAPVTSAALALIRAYVRNEGLGESEKETEDIAVKLAMSTAEPIFDEEYGYYEPVRHQGAGIVNVSDAMAAHAYLSVKDTFGERPKLELGDDPSGNGIWNASFTVTNISEFDQVYDLDIAALTLAPSGISYRQKEIGCDLAGDTHITVKAHEEKEVNVTLSLTEGAKQLIMDTYEVGGFAEGFIFLTPAEGSEDSTQLSIPFVGYYGDWNEHPLLDVTPMEGYGALMGINAAVTLDAYADMYEAENDGMWDCSAVGYNPLEKYDAYTFYHDVPEGYMTVSSIVADEFREQQDAVKVLDRRKHSGIYSVSLALFKNIEEYTVRIVNAETGEQYTEIHKEGFMSKEAVQLTRELWDFVPVRWAADDAEGNPLPEGTRVNIMVDVSAAGGKAHDSCMIPVTIDNTNPHIAGELPTEGTAPAVSTGAKLAVTASGRKYLKFDVSDNMYIAAAQVGTSFETVEYSTEIDEDGPEIVDVHYSGLSLVNDVWQDKTSHYTVTFEPAEKEETAHVSFDVSDYESETYAVTVCDYAGNRSFYQLSPAERAPLSIHLDPSEMTVDLPTSVMVYKFRVLDDDGAEIDGFAYQWSLSGASSPVTSMLMRDAQSVVVTSRETSPLLTLTVSDPADPSAKAEALIHIRYPQPDSLTLDIHNALMQAGDTLILTAETEPAGALVTWTSSDESILKVTQSGEVQAVKAGKAVITASGDKGKSDSCEITVLFTDVTDERSYYFNPVYWAVQNGITNGYRDPDGIARTFGPERNCTREAVVTFLWRLAGKPEPVTAENPFSDVSDNKYYYKAVLWAAENGITKGYSDGTFRPDETCLREHVVTFLYRFSGSPDVNVNMNPFNDTVRSDYYYRAAVWANQNGIAKGYSEGEHAGGFGPKLDCLREHVVTFLYRYEK